MSETPNCPCCGDLLAAPADEGGLCPACRHAMETPSEAIVPVTAAQMGLTEPAGKTANETATTPEASRPAKWRYPITKTLLTINFGVSVCFAIAHAAWKSSEQLTWATMNWGPFTLGGQWWRLQTSTLVHAGLGHLLGNLLVLWILGKRAEQLFGKWTFLVLYLACGLAGSIGSLAFDPEITSVGASGAIFGLAGALISAYGLKGLKLSLRAQWKLVLLILWTAFEVYPSPGVDNAAHAAGLLSGLILGGLLSKGFWDTAEQRRRLFARTALVLALSCVFIRYYHGYVVLLKPAIRALNHGHPDEALPAIDAALQKNPKSVLANNLAAEAYLRTYDYTNAQAAALRVLSVDAADEDAFLSLGLAKLHSGHCEEAHNIGDRLYYRIAGTHGSSRPVTLDDAFSLSVASCDLVGFADRTLAEGNLDDAIAYYRIAIHQNGNSYRAQLGLAKAYERKGMKKEAEAAAAQAAQMRQAPSSSH